MSASDISTNSNWRILVAYFWIQSSLVRLCSKISCSIETSCYDFLHLVIISFETLYVSSTWKAPLLRIFAVYLARGAVYLSIWWIWVARTGLGYVIGISTDSRSIPSSWISLFVVPQTRRISLISMERGVELPRSCIVFMMAMNYRLWPCLVESMRKYIGIHWEGILRPDTN